MVKQVIAAVATGAVLVAVTACAAPGSGAPSDSADPSVSISQSTSTSSETSAQSTPSQATPSQATPSQTTTPSSTAAEPAPQPGAEPWPPSLLLSEILEAGTTTIELGKVSLTLPAGFAQDAAGDYSSAWPSATGPATITVTQVPATGTASDALAEFASWARSAPITIPNAATAAIADAVEGGVQTWGLAIVDSTGTATVATFTAAPQDFQDYLLYQSVCSVVVSA